MLQKLNNYELKSFKSLINIKHIITIFKTVPFILFFYYDFFNSSERLILRKKLNTYKLKTCLVKNEDIKKLSKIINNKKFYNLLLGNVLLIYNQDNQLIDKETIKILLLEKKLILIGGKWYNKIYRSTQIEKYIKIDDLVIKKKLIKELLQVSYCLKNTLSRIKLKI